MKKKYKLSNRELEVMQVLWSSETPLAATDIPKFNKDLNINTVQVALKNLIKKSYIKVADIVYHNTVLTRTFEPVLTQEDYMIEQFKAASLNIDTFVAAFLKEEKNTDTLQKLEQLITDQKAISNKERE